ncbi:MULTISPECIES: polysaccharide biosynthesis tyrosine autokinase [Burkholderia]|jgi:tyrosine-protein kinase Etk/Wzc|uniref:Polysaccharide biosynthesis tyrosine autokinase n=3 Tax=Burkholderia contaminans TaxID=488447 RepID=A0A1E3FMT2_9BURK|nr:MULTISPECIES: polysaccharide biosynthesis tyrosine autokinase [Burkholderia]MBA9832008.1 polysaccharide biosynthesis tyrosine autokinase [Burkholderia contaminans]MBA9838614.1 polysaccharide biosynthesis tyrosine autokinase [Burkholderia contaminans]MBA9863990.1 polysaccharide biosynthesis tyrosine autokinase [Burkholderia contaminans]MBA9906240.1 polysaccharide biosynthesis tyrosine autokinase [Burkholderia contaminans]MBA9930259.1 polysaccharide biosynthesis tyrosine autokinase [Burkholde
MNKVLMNRASCPLPETDLGDEPELVRYADLVLTNRWLVAGVAAAVFAVGAAYALLAKPVYESNLLIQVEDNTGSPDSLLGSVSSLFDAKIQAAAEIEILKSRMVVGHAVENLRLYVDAQPKRFPLIGNAIAKRAHGLSHPGLFGFGGYGWGNESIDIGTFDVPKAFEGETFELTALPDGRFRLKSGDLDRPIEGVPGQLVESTQAGGTFRIRVDALQARPGAAFRIERLSELKTLQKLQKHLNVSEIRKQSNVISVSLKGEDPDTVASILNTIGTAYIAQNVKRKSAEAEKSLAFLETVAPQLKQNLEQAEAKYNAMRRKRGTFNLGIEAQAYLQDSIATQGTLLALQQKRAEASTRFAADHPDMQALDRQIDGAQQKIDGLSARLHAFPDIEQDELRLRRDVEVGNEMYVGVLNNIQQLKLVSAGKVGNVREVDHAPVPEEPVEPRKALILALSAILGVMLGVTAAVARESLFGGVTDASDIERRTGLTVYGTIPDSAAQRAAAASAARRGYVPSLLADEHPYDPSIESLKSLRTTLSLALLDADNNRVLLTGPSPGVGKSFVSANLAAVMAAAGQRVLLVDADMRRGHLNEAFDVPRTPGLSDLLTGSVSLHGAVRRVSEGLDFMPTGTPSSRTSELLQGEPTHRLLDEMSAAYDVVIIDTPPVLAVPDASILAPHCATAFLVTRARQTTIDEIAEASKQLSRVSAGLPGVLFNGVDTRALGYRSRYGAYRYAPYGSTETNGGAPAAAGRRPRTRKEAS